MTREHRRRLNKAIKEFEEFKITPKQAAQQVRAVIHELGDGELMWFIEEAIRWIARRDRVDSQEEESLMTSPRDERSKSFAADIESVADGEEIIGICIGPYGWGSYYTKEQLEKYPHCKNERAYREEECAVQIPFDKYGKVLSWEEARPLLDYPYDTSYGAPSCHAITCWTTNRIITVVQYDGLTSIVSDPRNPHDHVPSMAGG